MKKSDIKDLEKASKLISDAKDMLEEARNLVEPIRDDLQYSYESKSEKWQESDKGEEAQSIISSLESAIEYLGTCEESADDAVGYVEDVLNNF